MKKNRYSIVIKLSGLHGFSRFFSDEQWSKDYFEIVQDKFKTDGYFFRPADYSFTPIGEEPYKVEVKSICGKIELTWYDRQENFKVIEGD